MKFGTAILELGAEVEKKTGDVGIEAKLKSALNFAKVEVGKYALWRHLEVPNAELVIVPRYETGTATVTNGSRTVTIVSPGVVSTDFKGRYFTTQKSTMSYEIVDVSVSANTLSLRSEYIDDSGTSTYSIAKKFYRLPSDIRTILPNRETRFISNDIEVHGYDEYASDYSVGTITLTEGSKNLTGTGTAFYGNVFSGDIVQGEAQSELYRIRSVQSDTKIVMVNRATKTQTVNYTITSDTPYIGTKVGIGESTKKIIMRFSYIRSLYPMISNGDDTELPIDFDRVIKDFAKADFKRIVAGASDWINDLNLAQRRLEKLEMNRDLVYSSAELFKLGIPRGMGRN